MINDENYVGILGENFGDISRVQLAKGSLKKFPVKSIKFFCELLDDFLADF